MSIILHITDTEEWNAAYDTGFYTPPSLQAEGFIHCSTPAQTVETANSFFAGRKGLLLLCIDTQRCDAEVKYEGPSRGGSGRTETLYPHIYGPLNISAVMRSVTFSSNADGMFTIPAAVNDLLTSHAAG